MFKIRVLYDDTTVQENIPCTVVIMYIDCGKTIGYYLDNQPIDYLITPFFHKYGVSACWFILDHPFKQRTQF